MNKASIKLTGPAHITLGNDSHKMGFGDILR